MLLVSSEVLEGGMLPRRKGCRCTVRLISLGCGRGLMAMVVVVVPSISCFVPNEDPRGRNVVLLQSTVRVAA